MVSVFDIYDYMPHVDCGKCLAGSCIKYAQAIAKGEARPEDCSVLHDDPEATAEIYKLLSEDEDAPYVN